MNAMILSFVKKNKNLNLYYYFTSDMLNFSTIKLTIKFFPHRLNPFIYQVFIISH